MLWSLLLLHYWCLPLAEPQEKPEGKELGIAVHWDEPPRADSRAGKGEKGSDSRWQVKSKLHNLHISSGRWRQQAPWVLFSRGEKLKPRKFSGTHRGDVVEPDWYARSLAPTSSDWSLIFGHPGPSSLPKHPAQPRCPHWALWDPTVCAIPHSVSHSTYSYWAFTSPRLWGYRASLGFVSYRWGLCHAFCLQNSHIFSPALPHPLSQLMTWLHAWLGKWKSVLSPPPSFLISRDQHAPLPPCIRTEDVSLLSNETSLTIWAVDPIPSHLGSFSFFTIINPFTESFLLD